MKQIAPSSIYAVLTATMMFLANIQPPERGGSGKHFLVFQGALGAPSSAPLSLDARVPNQFTGLAFTPTTPYRGLLSMRAISG